LSPAGAAIEFQQAMADANRDQPEDSAVVFRLHLHLDDASGDRDVARRPHEQGWEQAPQQERAGRDGPHGEEPGFVGFAFVGFTFVDIPFLLPVIPFPFDFAHDFDKSASHRLPKQVGC
jgi:hypothetical protein